MGKHKCPKCGRVSRFRITLRYLAALTGAWLVLYGIVVAIVVGILRKPMIEMGRVPYVIMTFIVGCAVLLPLDKFCERFRKLEK